MRVIFLLFDSLNRRALESYGGTTVKTPNFTRLAQRAVSFDNHYVGSMPCMPARRDLHTGRLNFLHRSWGPLEPFDNSFPELLQAAGVYSHLVSDHYHYFEDGGWTYHQRYSSFEFIRGQEADKWQAMVRPPLERLRERYHALQMEDDRKGYRLQNLLNREAIKDEQDYPAVRCFEQGLAFLDANRDADDWLLQIETFDPHEPFMAPERFRARLSHQLWRAGPRLAALPRDRGKPRRDRRAPRQLRGPGRHVRPLSRPAARLHGQPRPLAGHRTRADHRPRLHAQ